jgi:hypothetical protein
MRTRFEVTPALRELLAATGELDRILDGHGLTFDSPPPPPARPPQGFYIPPPDWDEELAERARLERQPQQQERDRIVAEELAKITDDAETPPKPTPPAPKRSKWRRDQM